MPKLEVIDRGLIDYAQAWALQQRYFEALLKKEREVEVLILCQHPHVYTLGRSGDAHNLLVDSEFLARIGASYYHTDRGGDITYHGPGQLVGYPILDLGSRGLGLKGYIDMLEQGVIDTLAEWGIPGERRAGATGVWIENKRKICAIGVRASRFVTMHGFALNVTTDLSYFDYINPCGFVNRDTAGVTSMARELACSGGEGGGMDMANMNTTGMNTTGMNTTGIDMEQVKARFVDCFCSLID